MQPSNDKDDTITSSDSDDEIQGVVTVIGPVEPFATGIKMKSSNQEAS